MKLGFYVLMDTTGELYFRNVPTSNIKVIENESILSDEKHVEFQILIATK